MVLSSLTPLWSQTEKELQERREEIKRLFGENFFNDLEEFDKRYQELMKEMFEGGHGNQNFFDDDVMDQFMQKMRPHEYINDGDIKWVENEQQKILMLKIKQSENSPLNISIEKGSIEISGTITQKEETKQGGATSYSSYTSSFSRSLPVPDDVEEKSAKIDNKNGDITISFDKKESSIIKKNPSKNKPLLFKKGEKTI